METTPETTGARRPFAAGFWLMAAIPLSSLMSLPLFVFNILSFDIGNDDPSANAVLFLGHLVAGFMWAHSLTSRSGLANNQAVNIAGALAFTLLVMGGKLLVTEYDPRNILGPLFLYRQHLLFEAIFVLWTGMVVGGTGFTLGLSLENLKLALKLLGAGFLSGGGTFLVVAFLMDWIGFRVGAPRAEERFTMLVVSIAGIWAAALVGSAVFGKVLAASSEQ